MTKNKLQKNNMLENIMIGICIFIILVLIYLIYNKLSKEENFRFQTLKGKTYNNYIENSLKKSLQNAKVRENYQEDLCQSCIEA